MRHTIQKLFILLCCCLFWSILSAKDNFSFDAFTQRDGLSNNRVHTIYQDRDGWIWMGTSYGLNCFDGLKFTTYNHSAEDTLSLSANLVRVVYEDTRRNLWIGLEDGGLCRFDRGRRAFYRNQTMFTGGTSVNDIAEDKSGNLWLATSAGVVKMSCGDDGKYRSQLQNFDLKSLDVRKIAIDAQNRLWIGTFQGLYVYDIKNKALTYLMFPDSVTPDDEIWEIYIDDTERVWIGTYNSGLFYVEPWNLTVIKSSFNPGNERASTIRAVYKEKEGRIWIGTRAGLFLFDGSKYEQCAMSDQASDLSSVNSVLSLCMDNKGDLWVGTRRGVNYLIREKQFIQRYVFDEVDRIKNGEVYAFWCNNKDLWIGMESGGVAIFDRKKESFSFLNQSNSKVFEYPVKTFLRVGNNELWVGTYRGGIYVVDVDTRRVVKTYKHDEKDANSLGDDRIWGMYCDRSGNVWIASSRGIDQFDSTRKFFTHRRDILPVDEQVNWISQDMSGDMWFGCENMLIIYNPRTQNIKRYYRKTRAMAELSVGNYYIATYSGVARFDKERGFYHFFTEQDGLVNNYTHSMLMGADSSLWIATAHGLSRFNTLTEEFQNFLEKDGLQDNQFNYGAFIRTNDDELIFGGINGFNIVKPQHLCENNYVPPVYITSLRVFNEYVTSNNPKYPGVTTSLVHTKDITLRYDQNMLTFSFIALNYVMAENNRYMYKLEGLEDEWVDAGNATYATYANLAPGDYTFKVIGTNNDGVWNNEGASLHIRISPPFYATAWFQCLMLLVIMLILILLARLYVIRTKNKNNILLERDKTEHLREVDRMKLQFFTNISHEIRTPLTLISGPVNKLYEEVKNEDEKELLGIVKVNTERLLKLISQLLDFRKLEAGEYSLQMHNGDMVRFVKDTVASFNYLSKEKNVALECVVPQERFTTGFDSDKMEKILINIISNAFKYTKAGGKVRVSLEIGKENYTLRVSDTGVGIPEDSLENIFNCYFQSPSTGNSGGTGIGLSITKSFVELMGGTIEVKSKVGVGTQFKIELPFVVEGASVSSSVESTSVEDEEEEHNDLRLLIVDDNEDIRTFIKTQFKSRFRVYEAENGKRGFEVACDVLPDIILADMLMPEMDGLEMYGLLRNDERTSHIPVIMLTAVSSPEQELKCLQEGMTDYIVKPFDVRVLEAKIESQLRIRDEIRQRISGDMLLQPSNVVTSSPDEKFLRKAVDIVEKYMDDTSLDVERFASEMGVSRMQLYRKFEALAGMTAKEFIRKIRLKRAVQLLEQKNLTVSEVAWAVGFRDLSHFRKCFKDVYGVVPSEYAERKN